MTSAAVPERTRHDRARELERTLRPIDVIRDSKDRRSPGIAVNRVEFEPMETH